MPQEWDAEASVESPLLTKHIIPATSNDNARSVERRSLKRPFVIAAAGALAGVALLGYWTQSCGDGVRGGSRRPVPDPHWPTDVGYAGPTPTGSEAMAAATSFPHNYDSYPLNPPTTLGLRKSRVPQFLDVQAWRRNSNAVWGDYYSSSGTQDQVPNRSLYFLFQREQLFQLGTGFRVKYGALLDPDVKPVFRTESQDRMLKSALNFAAGFFGIPYEEQYHQLITLEWPGLNNTLSPYMTCKNANRGDLNLSRQKLPEWIAIYLKDALVRLQAEIEGFELTLADLFNMQQMAAYEVVALGGSRFGDIFTEEEWEGFEYGMDLLFWYGYSFGNPAQAAVGLGWVQEWLARVTRVPIIEFNSTTNSSYHTSEYFPFNQKIYVDATHDTSLSPLFCHPLSFLATNAPRTVISAIITTLNFASFASSGPLPSNFVPKNRSFDTSRIAPFAANLVSQIMSSPGKTTSGKAVRWLLNDGVVPLDHIEGCGKDGLCDLDVFVEATRNAANEIDWAHDCLSPYTIEEGDAPILDGRPPKRK